MPGTVTKLLSKVFGPPALPKRPDRTSTLTPSPSCESLIQSMQAAVGESPLFRKIPFEVRQMILVATFGGRVVHMDLIYDHPRMPLAKRCLDPELQEHHAYLGPRLIQNRRANKRRRRRWQWQSSVCHRTTDYRIANPAPWTDEMPYNDNCHDPDYRHMCNSCWGVVRERLDYCFIGVMGWLLSCRQALVAISKSSMPSQQAGWYFSPMLRTNIALQVSYAEGIEILYQTNTIHIPDSCIFRNLPRFLPPQRLANIRSLEVVWSLHMFEKQECNGTDHQNRSHSAFLRYLEMIPTILPELRKLFLSLQGEMFPPRNSDCDLFNLVDTLILAPVDMMVRGMGARLKKFDLALPYRVYSIIRYKTSNSKHYGLGSRRLMKMKRERVWRDLTKPDTIYGHLPGYWINRGHRDISLDSAAFDMDAEEPESDEPEE
ncbi:hypothetical protein MaudCBS49596_005424 [Microsporum audouinii]